MSFITKFLDNTSMYKVILYCLWVMAIVSILFGFLGFLPYGGLNFIYSFLAITVSCYFSNLIFAKIFKVPTNAESYSITSLILFFILTPIHSFSEFWAIILVSILAMASKFIFVWKRKLIFNPAA